MISAIFACDSQGGIGKDGSMPWSKNKEDLSWFREHTLGHTVVMGGNTWRDPVMPKPLQNRINIVVSHTALSVPGGKSMGSDWLAQVQELSHNQHVFIIGGAQILVQAREIIQRVYLTQFPDDYRCDVKIDLNNYLAGLHCTQSNTTTASYSIWNKTI
jgi:dihydrofolate reductase